MLMWLRNPTGDNAPSSWAWDKDTAKAAAQYGKARCLEWLVTSGCPVDEDVCYAAAGAETNSYRMIRFLRSRVPPCPWDRDDCHHAATLVANTATARWIDTQPR